MRYSFLATSDCPALGLSRGERLTIDSDRLQYFVVERRIPADQDGLLEGILDGSLEDISGARPADEVEELARLVVGRPNPWPRPRPRSRRRGPLRLRK